MNELEPLKTPLLSICVTSYNRINELKRCLDSIDSIHKELIEIVISEDCSPKKFEIKQIVEQFSKESKYTVLFNSNEVNLGYDCNLGKLTQLARGKYILFMSDDDMFVNNAIDKVIEGLISKQPAVAFSPFISDTTKEFERKFEYGFTISPNIANVKKYLYCSILFSGLIFERSKILNFKADPFKNLLYFQVYLFSSVLYKHGGYYFNIPLVNCMGDGENGFGISDSSNKNALLADRKSIYSNLEYHKGLIQVIKYFDENNNTDIIKQFEKEYSLRSYTGLARARRIGRKEMKNYWEKMNGLGINLTWIAKVYNCALSVFGYKVCNFLTSVPKNMLLKYRSKIG